MRAPTSTLRIIRFFMLLAMMIFADATYAQCATSVDTGGGNCVPPDAPGMPGYSSNVESAQPQHVWKDSWGAIVIDSPTGSAGTVTGRDTRSDAIRDATRDCEIRGARDCKMELAYSNQCAAVAWGDGGHGVARGPNEADVGDDALSYCAQSAKNCKVVYSGCSKPVRVW